jgi:hypothetical protein
MRGDRVSLGRAFLSSVAAALMLAIVLTGVVDAAPPGDARAAQLPPYARDVRLPPGVQYGTGDIALTCSLAVGGHTLMTATEQAQSTGALPTIVSPGQSVWITSVRTRVTIPVAFANSLYASGVRKLKVKVQRMDMELHGAASSIANVVTNNRLSIPPVMVQQGKPIVVYVGYQKPLSIGPLATTKPGVAHLQLGETLAQVTAITASGTTLAVAETDCPTPNPAQLIATVRIAGPPRTGAAKVPGQYPVRNVPEDSLVGSTGFRYMCQFHGVGTFPVDGSGTQFGSFGPHGLVFSSGGRLAFQDTQGQMTLTPGTVDRLLAVIRSRPGGNNATQLRLTMRRVDVTAVHLLPANATFFSHPVIGSAAQIRPGRPLHLSFPHAGAVLKPFYLTAGAPGIADVWLGDEAFALQPLSAGGAPIGGAIQAYCPTPHPLVPVFPAVVQ